MLIKNRNLSQWVFMLPMMNDELTEVNRLFLILHILVYFGLSKGSWNKWAKYEKLGCTWTLAITNAYNQTYGIKY